MSSGEQVYWRDSSRTKLPPLNHVLIDRLTLQALAYSTISDLTTLGTGSENDSLVTGLRGEVLLNQRLMKWTVRWDWSPGLGESHPHNRTLALIEKGSTSTIGTRSQNSAGVRHSRSVWSESRLRMVLPGCRRIISTRY